MMIVPFYVLTQPQAQVFEDATASSQVSRIEARQIVAGPHAGMWGISARNAENPDFAFLADEFAKYEPIDLDTDEAWPPEEDEV